MYTGSNPVPTSKVSPKTEHARAIGAAVARFPDTEEVTGSNPVSPTRELPAIAGSFLVADSRRATYVLSAEATDLAIDLVQIDEHVAALGAPVDMNRDPITAAAIRRAPHDGRHRVSSCFAI